MMEVVAALAIISGALVTLLAIRNNNIRLAAAALRRTEAVRLAQSKMDETLALLRSKQTSLDDAAKSEGKFEANEDFKWKFAVSELKNLNERSDGGGKPLPEPKAALLTITVSYADGDSERSVSLSSVVRK